MRIVSRRCIEILKRLHLSADPVPVRVLAEHVGVSERTARYDLSDLRLFLSQYGVSIETVPGAGLALAPVHRERVVEILDQWDAHIGPDQHYKDAEERCMAVAIAALAGQASHTIAEWEEQLGVSRSTCLRDLSAARKQLASWGLRLMEGRTRGISVISPESEIRSVLSRVLLSIILEEQLLAVLVRERGHTHLLVKPTPFAYLNNIIEAPTMELIVEAAMQAFQTYETRPADNELISSLVRISVACKRMSEGKMLQEAPAPSFASKRVLGICKRLVRAVLGDGLEDGVRAREAGALAALLPNPMERAGAGEPPGREIESTRIATYVLQRIIETLGVDLGRDPHLLELFRLHLGSAIARAHAGDQVRNPFLDAVKAQYPVVFSACTEIFADVSSKFGVALSPDEIAYIARYAAAALGHQETAPVHSGISAVLICGYGYGYGTVALLKSALKRRLPWVHVIEQISVFQAIEHRYDGADIILTTVEVPVPLPLPVIQVNPMLPISDIRKIEAFSPWRSEGQHVRLEDVLSIIHRHCTVHDASTLESDLNKLLDNRLPPVVVSGGQPSLLDALGRERTLARVHCANWDEAVRRASTVLLGEGEAASTWLSDVYKIRDDYGQLSVLPTGICMPHGFPRPSYSLSITLITLDEPLEIESFGENVEVRVVMAIASPHNEIQARALDELFSMIDSHVGLARELSDTANSSELYELFVQRYRELFPG